MFLFLVIFISQFSAHYCCLSTPSQDATPEVPVLPCTTCVAPMFTDPPGTFKRGTGSIVAGDPVGPGCVTFVITCDAATPAGNAVVIGANMDTIPISTAGTPGPKMATIGCNADGQLEGRTVPDGDTVIITSVYCSNN
uniref:Uncharacterized protein n=1 Tax=Panagrolaimus sp. ES5 TaxID=591445 RepID=A0AC34FYZ7_9BILA